MAITELLQGSVEGKPSIYACELPEVPSRHGMLRVACIVRRPSELLAVEERKQ